MILNTYVAFRIEKMHCYLTESALPGVCESFSVIKDL